MSVLLTADVHLTEKPQDEYRWGLFDWLSGLNLPDELIICGDMTEAKDKHSAKLVNRLVDKLARLSDRMKVIFLKGNHDYYDPQTPFFEFIENMPCIRFISKPTIVDLSIGRATFIPAGVKWDFKLHEFPYVFTHATFKGAVTENGTTLTGVDPVVFNGYKGICYSGDIHVPQTLAKGKIVYIGAPYHTRFGDSFEPRLIYVDNGGKAIDWHYSSPRKCTFFITKPKDLLEEYAVKGDHVKVKCYLKRSEYVEWRQYKEEIRSIAKEREWELFGIESIPLELTKSEDQKEIQSYKSTEELVLEYGKKHKVSDEFLKLGKELI